MLSKKTTDIREIAYFMLHAEYAALALKPKHKFTLGSGKNAGFDWEFGSEVFDAAVKGRNFQAIPFFSHVQAEYRLEGGDEWCDDIKKLLRLYEVEQYHGADLTALLGICPGPDKDSYCDLFIRCGKGTGLKCPMPPANFGFSVERSAPKEIVDLVEWLGFDEDLKVNLQKTNKFHLTFLSLGNDRLYSLGGVAMFDRLTHAIEIIKSHMAATDIAYFSPTFRVGGCGYPLAVCPTDELLAIDKGQRARADWLIGMIADFLPERDWKFWMHAVSKDAVFGFNWDRIGSVVESVAFERKVASLKAKGVSNDFLLTWDGKNYRLEIKGMDSDSDLGNLFRSFGLEFEDR
jgi:hypothetical protein